MSELNQMENKRTIQRINRTKSLFFEKKINIDKWPHNQKMEGEDPDEKRDITTSTNKMQRIIRKYFHNLSSNKSENLEETDKFLDVHD
jgi:hypothetical protein